MADYDVIVIGAGPGGYSAALACSKLGATVALVEPEKPGGACVHYSCIPTNALAGAATTFLGARELAVFGAVGMDEHFNFARANARTDALIAPLSDSIRTALRMHGVSLMAGRGTFASPHAVRVNGANGESVLTAEAFVIATGTRWEAPVLPGISPERVLTVDAVRALVALPKSAVVSVDGLGEVPFGLEYAQLLAIAGTEVTVVTGEGRLIVALDGALHGAVLNGLGDLAIEVREGASITGGAAGVVNLRAAGADVEVPADIVVTADVGRPFFKTLNLEAAGVIAWDSIPVDDHCRTNVEHIFAAGDVTGGVMLSSAASHMGEVAAANAVGGDARCRLGLIPRVLQTTPGVAWVGSTEEKARAEGRDVIAAMVDLSFNARAVTLGRKTGMVKLVADRYSGELLGVHALGPEAGEIAAVASALMQAQATVHELAATIAWHPSVTEGLIEAARRLTESL